MLLSNSTQINCVCVGTINVEFESNHYTIYGSTDESLWQPHVNLPVIQDDNIVFVW